MDRTRAGYLEGIVSVIVNTALFGLKLWAGIASGSIALTADAWHTFSDSLSSVIVIIGAKLSSRAPSKQRPFGHGRWEQVAALAIAFLLAAVAFEFFKNSIIRISHREEAHFGNLAIIIMIISIAAKEVLARFAFYLGKKTSNLSIMADGWHHRTDALSSVIVLAGILLENYFWWIDAALGMAISGFLLYTVYKIAKAAIDKILGEIPDPRLIRKIKKIARNIFDSDLQLHHFHIHNYEGHKELTLHMKLDNKMTIEEGHRIATRLEESILEEFGIIATVHMEPLFNAHDKE
jgi:cation diffusion facilitator family transporter